MTSPTGVTFAHLPLAQFAACSAFGHDADQLVVLQYGHGIEALLVHELEGLKEGPVRRGARDFSGLGL